MNVKKTGLKDYLLFVDQVEIYLEKKAISDAREIEHGQWELPFEALLLELMKLPYHTVQINFGLVETLANEADLIESSVLDVNTWERFNNWSHPIESS